MKGKKKAFLLSFLSLLMCVSMFIGTTFAWFTDSVTSGVNKIVAGNLDVEVYHRSASVTTDKTIENETKLFCDVNGDAMLWEPGAVSYETFTITNEGSLALKYKLAMNILDYNAVSGTSNTLKDVLKVKVLSESEILSDVTRNTVQALDWNISDTLDVFNTAGNLEAGESDEFQVIVYWVPGANDNIYNVNNGKETTDGQPLFISFGINVVASQLSHESDSFGPDYDQGIALPDLPVSINKVFQSAPITVESVTESIEVKNVSTNAGVAVVEAASVNAVINALTSQATDKADDSDLSTVIYLNVQTADKAETSVTYEIDMYATLTYTGTNGESKTTTLDSLNGKLADKIVTASMEIGKGLSNVAVKHHETPMTQLSSATAEEEGYYYDKTNGVLTIKSKSFSPFTVEYTLDAVAAIGEDLYATLEEAIAAAENGDTVVLLRSVDVSGAIIVNNGKNITLDLNGYDVVSDNYYVFYIYNANFHITGTGTIFENVVNGYAPIVAKGSDTDVANYTVITIDEGVTLKGDYAGIFVSKDVARTYKNYGLVVNMKGTIDMSGVVDGYHFYGIYINGQNTVTTGNVIQFNLDGATIKGCEGSGYDDDGDYYESQGIYAAGYAKWNIKNSNIVALGTAIEIRAGELNINGGNYTATTENAGSAPNGNGSTTNGAAIAIAQHTTKLPISVNIADGTFNGVNALIEANPQNNSAEDVAKISIAISDGTFNGAISSEDVTGFITGGSYSTKPELKYLASGYKATLEESYYVVSICTDHTYEDGICTECGKVQETWLAIENAMTEAPEGYSVEGDVITISSNYGLAWFAKQVNAGNNFANYTVTLNADIDLCDYPWAPINGFTGTFDGKENTISNIFVNGSPTGNGYGLFGASNAKSYKNVKIHNVYVVGNSALGALVGKMHTGTVDNVHVTGNIMIGINTQNGHIANFNSSYAGGIVGYGYAKISNCSVKGDDGSTIGHGRQVGGIYGFSGEGNFTPCKNCTVENVTIIGTHSIGGILGWAHYGNNVENCSVKNVNVKITTNYNSIGFITGTTNAEDCPTNSMMEFYGNTVENSSLYVKDVLVSQEATMENTYAPYGYGPCYTTDGLGNYVFFANKTEAEKYIENHADMTIKYTTLMVK